MNTQPLSRFESHLFENREVTLKTTICLLFHCLVFSMF